ARALLPRVDQRATLGLVEGEVAEDREPVGMRAHGLDAELVRVRIPGRVRRENGRIDAAGVHLLQRVFLQVGGDLPVPRAGGVARVPEMNLRVDDQHGGQLPSVSMASAKESTELACHAASRSAESTTRPRCRDTILRAASSISSFVPRTRSRRTTT